MDQSTHLQIAARIHFALLRQYGEDIEIGALMKNRGDAREALWVCEACDDIELVSLARQFKACSKALAKAAALKENPKATSRPVSRQPAAPQDAARTRASAGSGMPNAPGLDPAPTAPTSGARMRAPSWFKRGEHA
jgi:hypothetical protein